MLTRLASPKKVRSKVSKPASSTGVVKYRMRRETAAQQLPELKPASETEDS